MQTALDLVRAGYRPTVEADATSSRTAENRDHALRRLAARGVDVATTEMVLF
jgi:nicotinamidase-related amidase